MSNKTTITLDITGCSTEHCIAKSLSDGSCPHLRTGRLGTEWYCGIFRDELLLDSRGDGTGKLLRWAECIEAVTRVKEQKHRPAKPHKKCGNCRRIRGREREWYCALEGPEATVEPSDPAEFCSAYIAAHGGPMVRRKYPTGMTAAERREYLEASLEASASYSPGDAIALEELRALWAIVDADTPEDGIRDYDALGVALDAYHEQDSPSNSPPTRSRNHG